MSLRIYVCMYVCKYKNITVIEILESFIKKPAGIFLGIIMVCLHTIPRRDVRVISKRYPPNHGFQLTL